MPFYGDKTIEAIWQSAKPVEGYNPNIWRKDFAGAWIRRDFLWVTQQIRMENRP